MNEIWKERQDNYNKQIFKYLKYIFNDNLVLALMFFAGGLGYNYSNWLKTATGHEWWVGPFLAISSLILSFFGKPVWLLSKADKVFLLPMTKQIPNYIKKSKVRTFLFNLLILIISFIVLFPLLKLYFKSFIKTFMFFIAVIILNLVNLNKKYEEFLFDRFNNKQVYNLLICISVIISLLVNPLFGLIVSLILYIIAFYQFKVSLKHILFDWNQAIKYEEKRLNQLNRIIGMFTEVKDQNASFKRRKWLDNIAKFLTLKNDIFSFTYSRLILRSVDYFGLIIRLLFIGGIIELFSNNIWIKLSCELIVVYLIVFQLKDQFKQVVQYKMINIYPVDQSKRQHSLMYVLNRIILVSVLFLLLCGCLTNFSILFIGLTALSQIMLYTILVKFILKVKK